MVVGNLAETCFRRGIALQDIAVEIGEKGRVAVMLDQGRDGLVELRPRPAL